MEINKGQSLIEFMIGIMLCLFLLGILIIVFQSAKTTGQYVDELIQTQEAATVFFYLLQQDLHATKEVKILNPQKIPEAIIKRMAKNTDGLLIQTTEGKIVYFISKTKEGVELSRKNLNTSSYIQDGLTANIKSLRIKYGLFISGKLEFLSAENVMKWNCVKLVMAQIKMQSDRLVKNQQQTYKELSFVVGVKL